MSTTYGNSTTGTFKHPAEIFNFQKLLSVPNPFNIDLSLYTATAAASASPIKPPSEAHDIACFIVVHTMLFSRPCERLVGPRQEKSTCTQHYKIKMLLQMPALRAAPDYTISSPAKIALLHMPQLVLTKSCDGQEGVASRLVHQLNRLCVQSGRHSRKCPQWRLHQGRHLGPYKDQPKGLGPARAAAAAAAAEGTAAAGATAAAAATVAASAAAPAAAAPPASPTSRSTLRRPSLLPQASRCLFCTIQPCSSLSSAPLFLRIRSRLKCKQFPVV